MGKLFWGVWAIFGQKMDKNWFRPNFDCLPKWQFTRGEFFFRFRIYVFSKSCLESKIKSEKMLKFFGLGEQEANEKKIESVFFTF